MQALCSGVVHILRLKPLESKWPRPSSTRPGHKLKGQIKLTLFTLTSLLTFVLNVQEPPYHAHGLANP
jgi:hypothetical protein